MLYRRFPFLPGAGRSEPGGPLHVPRIDQGEGRHDNPDVYGALYMSRNPASPVAELLKDAPRGVLEPALLVHEGSPYALAAFDERGLDDLVDLDDPAVLASRDLRPSGVATRNRRATQRLALRIHQEGTAGFEWWSTIEASWINVTLFAERVVGRLDVVGDPEPLTVDHPAVREAAEAVGVLLRF
jgi:hypothetical protein